MKDIMPLWPDIGYVIPGGVPWVTFGIYPGWPIQNDWGI